MTLTAPTRRRELAHRTGDGIEVTLFWISSTNKIILEVLDSRSGERLVFEVDKHAALDAFHHPYVYAPRPPGRDARYSAEADTSEIER